MIILITGGNRGLGKGSAMQLASKGYTVIVGSRKVNDELIKEFSAYNIQVIKLDLLDAGDMADVVKFVKDRYGKLDVLINNAAIMGSSKGVIDVEYNTIRETLDTNLMAPLKMMQVLVPLLKKSDDARIINVSSGMGAMEGMTGGHTAYRLSKSALNALTIMASSDLSMYGIKVFAVCPGWVKTDMGGPNAPRNLDTGANSITYLVDAQDVVNGKFYRDGEIIPW